MHDGILYTGVPNRQELKNAPGIPAADSIGAGGTAFIECLQTMQPLRSQLPDRRDKHRRSDIKPARARCKKVRRLRNMRVKVPRACHYRHCPKT